MASFSLDRIAAGARHVRVARRLLVLSVLTAGSVTMGGRSADALVVTNASPQSTNYVAPTGASDPGWANVAKSTDRSAVYLGNQWMLTARHAGILNNTVLDGGTFALIPGSEVTLTNPSGMGLSSLSDVRLYRIDTTNRYSGTPEELDANVRSISIANNSPSTNTEITVIASGPTKPDASNAEVHWQVDANQNWTQVASGGNQHGFLNNGTPRKAWGTNNVASNSVFPSGTDFVDGLAVVTSFGADQLVKSFVFDRNAGTNEAQARSGDSGAPVFVQEEGEWKLAGVNHVIFSFEGQSLNWSVYGQSTAFSDLSYAHYSDQLDDILNRTGYSVAGDINLDGVVTGDGSGSWENDDVTAFIDGWRFQQPEGDIISWKNGDLNQDGITNLSDFAILRSGLAGGSGASSLNLALLLGGSTAVPEPSTAVIACLALAMLGAWIAWRRHALCSA